MTVQINGDTGVSLVQDNTIQTADIVNGAVTPIKSSGFPFTMEYISPQQAVSNAAQITLSHGLGVAPKLVTYEYVCINADCGYSPGDVVLPDYDSNPGVGSTAGIQISKIGATQLHVAIGANGLVFMTKTTGVTTAAVMANWRLVVRAYA